MSKTKPIKEKKEKQEKTSAFLYKNILDIL